MCTWHSSGELEIVIRGDWKLHKDTTGKLAGEKAAIDQERLSVYEVFVVIHTDSSKLIRTARDNVDPSQEMRLMHTLSPSSRSVITSLGNGNIEQVSPRQATTSDSHRLTHH